LERQLYVDFVEKVACRGDSLLIQFSQRIGAHAMMGERRVMQEALFYGFSLERHVPDNHMLRKIDRFVDLSVEMLFAHLKRILRLGRLRLRGPSGAKDEFLFAATAQNLRKLAKLIPFPAPIFAV
jgi:hypothetical protein